jgi:hypothetical protein
MGKATYPNRAESNGRLDDIEVVWQESLVGQSLEAARELLIVTSAVS